MSLFDRLSRRHKCTFYLFQVDLTYVAHLKFLFGRGQVGDIYFWTMSHKIFLAYTICISLFTFGWHDLLLLYVIYVFNIWPLWFRVNCTSLLFNNNTSTSE